MIESLHDAREELKRVDHLIYVSLKYTRTVDVLVNILYRMINAYEFIMLALLKKAVEQNKIEHIPRTPKEKGNLVKELYEDDDVTQHIHLYFLFQAMTKAEHIAENEFRRHVTMITFINNKKEILNIDLVTSYFENQMRFYEKIKQILTENG